MGVVFKMGWSFIVFSSGCSFTCCSCCCHWGGCGARWLGWFFIGVLMVLMWGVLSLVWFFIGVLMVLMWGVLSLGWFFIGVLMVLMWGSLSLAISSWMPIIGIIFLGALSLGCSFFRMVFTWCFTTLRPHGRLSEESVSGQGYPSLSSVSLAGCFFPKSLV